MNLDEHEKKAAFSNIYKRQSGKKIEKNDVVLCNVTFQPIILL